jgi:hypothetical protein
VLIFKRHANGRKVLRKIEIRELYLNDLGH